MEDSFARGERWNFAAMRQVPVPDLEGSHQAREAARGVLREELAKADLDLAQAGLQVEASRAARGGGVPASGRGVVSLFRMLRAVEFERPGLHVGAESDSAAVRHFDRLLVESLKGLDERRREVSACMIEDESVWAGLSLGPVRLGGVVAASWHVAVLILCHRIAEGVCGAVRMRRSAGGPLSGPDKSDEVILKCIAAGQTLAKQIAGSVGLSESTVRNRIGRLRQLGLIELGAKPYRLTAEGGAWLEL